MTPQEVFNTVATHLFKQGKRAYDEDTATCMYRKDNGLKCAVGCLIPDDMYSPKMEEKGVSSLIENAGRRSYSLPPVIAKNADLLLGLQNVHDYGENWQSTDTMRNALRNVAEAHNLDASILDTLSFTDR